MLADHLRLYNSLNKNRVKYLVIGGVACAIYGSPRVTFDIDIFVEPVIKNCRALLKAMKEAGFGTAELTTAEKLQKNELTIVRDFVDLDILTKVKGIEFSSCWQKRAAKKVNGIKINFISFEDLKKSKKASGRGIDKYDLGILSKIK